jgi:hypothetical protein
MVVVALGDWHLRLDDVVFILLLNLRARHKGGTLRQNALDALGAADGQSGLACWRDAWVLKGRVRLVCVLSAAALPCVAVPNMNMDPNAIHCQFSGPHVMFVSLKVVLYHRRPSSTFLSPPLTARGRPSAWRVCLFFVCLQPAVYLRLID